MFSRFLGAVGIASGLLSALPLAAQQSWRVSEGTTTFQLPRQLINDLGLKLEGVRETAAPRTDHEEPLGFRATAKSTLGFDVKNWAFTNWSGGFVQHEGGFTLKGPRGTISLDGFRVEFRPNGTHENMFIVAGNKGGEIDVFALSHIKVVFNRPDETLVFGFADASLTAEAASKLGVNRHAGQILGMVTVSARATFVGGDVNDAPPQGTEGSGGVNGDVQLFTLGTMSSFGRIGVYPNGYSGLGMSTTSCNVSPTPNDNVDWYQQMDERHPVIPQNVYRVRPVTGAGTRFEQIGMGWVKHGFLSTNSPGCGTCQTPAAGGAQLGRQCTDTYGASLNASRSWLGPREEVDPNTGWWECTGSYFANYVNDCTQRFSSSGVGPTQYRLTVADADMANQPTGTQFIYEAWYVSHDDVNRYNNAAWRYFVPTWGGSSWSFSGQNPQFEGVAIDRWYDSSGNTLAPRAQPQSEGDAIVACKVTDMGNGWWHYEYAVYNYTLTRALRSFSVPIGEEVQIQNVEFRDVDYPQNTAVAASATNATTISVKTSRFLKVGDTVLISQIGQTPNTPVTRVISAINSGTSITLNSPVTVTYSTTESSRDSLIVTQLGTNNDWTFTRNNCALNWETSTYAQDPGANALVWGKVFNFRFDANVPPTNTTAKMGVFAPGAVTEVTAATQGPSKAWINPSSYTITGGLLSGDLSDLFCNEDSKLILRPGAVAISTLPPSTITVNATYPGSATVTSLKVRIESSASLGNIVQKLELKNFNNAGAMEEIDSRTLTTSDGLIEIDVPNAANYVENGTKLIVGKLSFKASGPVPIFPWQARIDQFVFIVN